VGANVDASELSEAAAEYESQLDEAVADDEDSRDYVTRLEEAWDEQDRDEGEPGGASMASAELMAEIERYLRDHPS
jgi:hypothetical protein